MAYEYNYSDARAVERGRPDIPDYVDASEVGCCVCRTGVWPGYVHTSDGVIQNEYVCAECLQEDAEQAVQAGQEGDDDVA